MNSEFATFNKQSCPCLKLSVFIVCFLDFDFDKIYNDSRSTRRIVCLTTDHCSRWAYKKLAIDQCSTPLTITTFDFPYGQTTLPDWPHHTHCFQSSSAASKGHLLTMHLHMFTSTMMNILLLGKKEYLTFIFDFIYTLKMIPNLFYFNVGTIICPATECFVHWRDSATRSEWGLNFSNASDARKFRDCCSVRHTCSVITEWKWVKRIHGALPN